MEFSHQLYVSKALQWRNNGFNRRIGAYLSIRHYCMVIYIILLHLFLFHDHYK